MITKQQIFEVFGGKKEFILATSMTRQAILLWPDEMEPDDWRIDYVYGLACRLGKKRKVTKLMGY